METVCFSLLFADRIITESNGKKGLIGVFSNFNFQQFPAIAPPWFIYAALANISGKHEFSINLVRDEAQHVVLPIAGEIDVQDDGKEIEIILPINNLTFQKPGLHVLTLNIDVAQIASRILRVNQVESSGARTTADHNITLKSQKHIFDNQNTSADYSRVSFHFNSGRTSSSNTKFVIKIPNFDTKATFGKTDRGEEIVFRKTSDDLLESLEK